MKTKWKRIYFFVLMTVFALLVYCNVNIYSAKTMLNTYTSPVVIDSYSKYSNELNYCINNQEVSVVLKIKKFNENTYNINKTMDLIYEKNPNLKYIISSYSYTGEKTKGISTINYNFNYINCDYNVNSVKEFLNTIARAVNSHKQKVVIKINNYTEAYNIKKVYDKINNSDLSYKYVFDSFNLSGLSGSKTKAYDLNIVYTEKVKTSTGVIVKATDMNTMSNTIKKAMMDGEKTVAFNMLTTDKFKITFKNFNALVDKVLNENSELRFFNSWNTYYSMNNTKLTYKVDFKLNYTKSEIITMQSAVEKKVKAIIASEITPDMSDYTKELKLHDYLVNNTVYDYKNLANNTIPPMSFTAYGVLIKGVGVCEGYSYAMKMLLKGVGIECSVITGTANGPHAWNLVKLGDNYYQLDATFDDPVVNNGEINVLKHNYFNLTDKEMRENHSWDASKYPICNSDIYKYTGNQD